ncbi:MAG: transposase, partial [Chloroflexi bacterium]|nr:transposase [Chloroflexota bacterium]
MKGRQRHLLVDTDGRITVAYVSPADETDRTGGALGLRPARHQTRRLAKVWADGNYRSDWLDQVAAAQGCTLEIVSREPETKGFQVQPRRWVVERTFAWLGK